MSLRHDLAEHLRTTLADFGQVDASDVAVYDAGVEIVSAPALVINPADPYQAVVTMKQEAIQVNLMIHLITNRTEPAAAFTYLEDLRVATTVALKTMAPAFRWVSFGSFGATEIGGTEYATAVLEIITTMRERVAT